MLKIVKRAEISRQKRLAIRVTAIILALLTASIFLLLLGNNPITVYVSMLSGAFGSTYRIQDTMLIAIPLIITSLGIMVAFKLKFWNIGAEGQIVMGAFTASYCALNYSHLPRPVLLTLMMVAGFIGGALWALIPALLKVKFGTNETIITLMLNYIGIKWITYLQYGPWKDPKSFGFPQIANFNKNALLPKVFGIHIGWIIAIVLVVILYILLNHTKAGYMISVVGESTETARYAGINVNQVIVYSLLVSGGICGLVGMIEASGVNRTLSVSISSGYGFTAIITTWLSGLKTSSIVPVCILFAAMIKGGSYIETAYQIPHSVADVLQSTILFFVLGSELFMTYRLKFNRLVGKEGV